MNRSLARTITSGWMTLAFLFILSCTGKAEQKQQAMQKPAMAASVVDLKTAMRKLWEDHITWTRNYIISSLAGLGDANAVANRLLMNQDDIGNAIKPFYGEEAGKKLSMLLRGHIMIAGEVVAAAKANNKMKLEKSSKAWTVNADSIAMFLAGANPNWQEKTLADMLHKHLDFTTDEVTSRLKMDWTADIAAYDKGHDHMLMFSDMLTDGIVKQFPDKFKE